MLERRDIKCIVTEDDATNWFGNIVDIKGGVNYFLKDKNYKGKCDFNGNKFYLNKYETLIDPNLHKLVDKVIEKEKIVKLYKGRCFNIETNDNRLKDQGKIKCYVSKQKCQSRIQYLDNYEFNNTNTFWKVFTPESAHGSFSGFGEIFIGKPEEIHTGSYISFKVNSKNEAESLKSYLKTNFANKMLSIGKTTQHINKSVLWLDTISSFR